MSLRKYLVIQRCAPDPQPAPSPERMRDMYAAFDAWRQKYQANILDLGGKLKSEGRILTTSGVTDGPFAEAKEIIGGFMVVSAESYDRALEVVRECPGVVAPGCSTEIRELAGP